MYGDPIRHPVPLFVASAQDNRAHPTWWQRIRIILLWAVGVVQRIVFEREKDHQKRGTAKGGTICARWFDLCIRTRDAHLIHIPSSPYILYSTARVLEREEYCLELPDLVYVARRLYFRLDFLLLFVRLWWRITSYLERRPRSEYQRCDHAVMSARSTRGAHNALLGVCNKTSTGRTPYARSNYLWIGFASHHFNVATTKPQQYTHRSILHLAPYEPFQIVNTMADFKGT